MIRLSGTPRSQRINPLPIDLLLSNVAHCPFRTPGWSKDRRRRGAVAGRRRAQTIDASIMCYGLASPVYEMSSAPARLKMSFARVTSSPSSVWIDSRILPDRTFPS
jgi:hypothetical protein